MRHLWLLALLLGCSSTPKRGDTSTDPRCGPFRWSDAKHGAFLVDIELGGVPGTFQVDTGLDVTSVYGGTFAEAHGLRIVRLEEKFEAIRAPLRIAGIEVAPSPVFVHRGMKEDGTRLSGSVGMDVFFGRAVTLDYPNQRLCIRDAVTPEQEAAFDFVPLRTVGRNRIQPEVTLGGRVQQRTVFDTGSSAFPLFVDKARWHALTGRDGSEPDTSRTTSTTWGHAVHVVGAPLKETLVVGSLRVQPLMTFFIEEAPNQISKLWGDGADGVLGNAPFETRTVIIDTTDKRRFGVSR